MREHKGLKVAFLYECPVVLPYNYEKAIQDKFDLIFTWNEDAVDSNKYLHFYWPQDIAIRRPWKRFNEKKQLVMVAGNKMSLEKDELYSARRNAAHFFERALKDQFDLFGQPAWDRHPSLPRLTIGNALKTRNIEELKAWFSLGRPFKCYRGSITDKIETIAGYRYSICYENMRNIKGYVTEKIWDCFCAGNVPIYWGCSNIEDYIPPSCFIDRRKFSSNRQLLNFISQIDESRYEDYLKNIEVLLESKNIAQWTGQQWGKDTARTLHEAITNMHARRI
jgi:hypothetical protein